jgi:DUF1365 family protein
LEAELAMAMSMPLAVRVETETGMSIPMTMWQECRGLIIHRHSQSLTLRMNADELTVTAIPKWWISNPLETLVIAEAISIAGVITTSRHQNR